MYFGNKNFQDLEYSDILKLIGQRIPESLNLDYKLELTDNTKELAKDVSSFALTNGGLLVYGIKTDDKDDPVPIENGAIVGIPYEAGLKEKVENKLLSSISPRVTALIRAIPLQESQDKCVLLILVPKSADVHMVMVGGERRYYKRYNFQSVPMDEYEVRRLYENCLNAKMDIVNAIKDHKESMKKQICTSGEGFLMISLILYPNYPEIIRIDERIKEVFIDGSACPWFKYGIGKTTQSGYVNEVAYPPDSSCPTEHRITAIYTNGLLQLSSKETKIFANRITYFLYHLIGLGDLIFSKELKLYSKIYVEMEIENMVGSELDFHGRKEAIWWKHDFQLKAELKPFTRSLETYTMKERQKEMTHDIITELFNCFGLEEPIGCFGRGGEPNYH